MAYVYDRKRDIALVRERVGGKMGEAIAERIEELYSVFDARMLVWFAELYDKDIGGFYFTTPARDTEGFLPDIESTYDVLTSLESMGMLHNYGDSFVNAIPDWLKAKVSEFLLSCQDEDGYFYLPQWGKNVSIARISRDLSSATYLLDALGVKPRYPLPAVAKCESEEKSYDMANAPERFRSKENYISYLEAYDLSAKSYYVGSELLAQIAEIKGYSEILGEDLIGITVDFFNKYKRRDNGLWQEKVDYHAVNGLHKISWVYNLAGAPIPDIKACADSALAVILSDEPATHVVSVYNPWHAIGELVKNMKRVGGEEYERFVDYIRSRAPEAIEKTIEKIKQFKMPDGSICYALGGCDFTAQGVLASPRDKRGASVDGACCGSDSLVSSVYAALDMSDILAPLYSEAELKIFLDTLEKVNNS